MPKSPCCGARHTRPLVFALVCLKTKARTNTFALAVIYLGAGKVNLPAPVIQFLGAKNRAMPVLILVPLSENEPIGKSRNLS